jgi:hypothetical protein
MTCKLWIRKTLASCLTVATLATYSFASLATTVKVAGDLTVVGRTSNGTPTVLVNGEPATSGRSIFSSSMIATPVDAVAIVSVGRSGKVEIAPDSVFHLTFDDNVLKGEITKGSIKVLAASNPVLVSNGQEVMAVNAGETAASAGRAQQDDDDDNNGGSAWIIWAVVFGGALAGIIYATTRTNNYTRLGGNTTVISPIR